MTQMCRVLYLYAFGFPVAWERSIIPKKHCDLRSQKKANSHVKVKGEQPSIKLTELSGAFLVLGVGLSFAFLVFLIEKIVAVWKENTTTEIELITIEPRAKEGEEVVETALNKAENGIIELVIAPQDTANKQDEITEPSAPSTNEEIIETAIATTAKNVTTETVIDAPNAKEIIQSVIMEAAIEATVENKKVETIAVTTEDKTAIERTEDQVAEIVDTLQPVVEAEVVVPQSTAPSKPDEEIAAMVNDIIEIVQLNTVVE